MVSGLDIVNGLKNRQMNAIHQADNSSLLIPTTLNLNKPTTSPSLADIMGLMDTGGGGGGYSGGGGGGGGGSAFVDHFYDINPLDQATFDWNVSTDARDFDFAQQQFGAQQGQVGWQNEFDTTQANWKQAMDERDYALAVGDQDLARQKQADANYWQGISAGLEQQGLNLQNQGQQLDYSAKLAGIAQQREASNQQYQIGMAGAANDAERNAIQDRWNQQQAYIAQMEDQTRRLLGGQQNQTAQFGAETDRAGTMGNLALENNKFIAEMARSPRDLFSLFFLQRGMTPDWDTMAAGGNPAMGDAIVPVNPMSAYKPTTAPASGFNLPAANMPIVSGGGGGAGSNQFLQGGGGGSSSSGGGGGAAVPQPNFLPYANTAPPTGPTQMPKTNVPIDINPSGKYAGVPVARLQPGMNLSTVGSDNKGSNFTMPAYYDEAKTRPIGADDMVTKGMQVWIDNVPRAATGTPGFTRATRFMAGDSLDANPAAGGAVPEVIENPTGAPIRVNANPQNLQRAASMGIRPRGGDGAPNQMSQRSQMQMQARMAGTQPAPAAQQMNGTPQQILAYKQRMAQMGVQPSGTTYGNSGGYQPMPYGGFTPGPRMIEPLPYNPSMAGVVPTPANSPASVATNYVDYKPGFGPANYGAPMQNMPSQLMDRERVAAILARLGLAQRSGMPYSTNVGGMARFALGTTAQQAYQTAGMGSLWQPDSNNSHLNGMDLPGRLAMLASYGTPISPALAASTTGRIAPTLNMGSAYTGARDAGVLPSLQTLGRQSKSETENFRGYAEGVAGIPWSDLVDFLQKPTQNLGKAQISRAA